MAGMDVVEGSNITETTEVLTARFLSGIWRLTGEPQINKFTAPVLLVFSLFKSPKTNRRSPWLITLVHQQK